MCRVVTFVTQELFMSKAHAMNEPTLGNGPRAWQPVGTPIPPPPMDEYGQNGRLRFRTGKYDWSRYAGLSIANWPGGTRHQRSRKDSD